MSLLRDDKSVPKSESKWRDLWFSNENDPGFDTFQLLISSVVDPLKPYNISFSSIICILYNYCIFFSQRW